MLPRGIDRATKCSVMVFLIQHVIIFKFKIYHIPVNIINVSKSLKQFANRSTTDKCRCCHDGIASTPSSRYCKKCAGSWQWRKTWSWPSRQRVAVSRRTRLHDLRVRHSLLQKQQQQPLQHYSKLSSLSTHEIHKTHTRQIKQASRQPTCPNRIHPFPSVGNDRLSIRMIHALRARITLHCYRRNLQLVRLNRRLLGLWSPSSRQLRCSQSCRLTTPIVTQFTFYAHPTTTITPPTNFALLPSFVCVRVCVARVFVRILSIQAYINI